MKAKLYGSPNLSETHKECQMQNRNLDAEFDFQTIGPVWRGRLEVIKTKGNLSYNSVPLFS